MRLFLICFIMSMGLVFAYTAPSYDDVDLVLDTGYTAQTYDSVDLVLGVVNITDSCTYVSGDWEIDCNDNCTIISEVNLGGNDMIFSNSGTFFIGADITNYANLNLSSGCSIIFDTDVQLISQ